MTRTTLTRIAGTTPAAERTAEEARKEQADRAFEAGVRWFLAVSRRALCAA